MALTFPDGAPSFPRLADTPDRRMRAGVFDEEEAAAGIRAASTALVHA
jgi:hypothetical protein